VTKIKPTALIHQQANPNQVTITHHACWLTVSAVRCQRAQNRRRIDIVHARRAHWHEVFLPRNEKCGSGFIDLTFLPKNTSDTKCKFTATKMAAMTEQQEHLSPIGENEEAICTPRR
jgi:hypothetical protein